MTTSIYPHTPLHILLIEDELSLREGLTMNLQTEGCIVTERADGTDLLRMLSKQYFDLIILDIMLPKIDGIDLCKAVRNAGYEVPILLLSAKAQSQDRAVGLKAGADDYMVKPFELDELLFRIRKLTAQRHSPYASDKKPQKQYVFCEGNIFYPESLEVKTHQQKSVLLSKKEGLLLKIFLEHKNVIISREKIFHYVYGYTVYPSSRTIDNLILKFRKYFEPTPNQPRFFISKRGAGYMYTEPETEPGALQGGNAAQ